MLTALEAGRTRAGCRQVPGLVRPPSWPADSPLSAMSLCGHSSVHAHGGSGPCGPFLHRHQSHCGGPTLGASSPHTGDWGFLGIWGGGTDTQFRMFSEQTRSPGKAESLSRWPLTLCSMSTCPQVLWSPPRDSTPPSRAAPAVDAVPASLNLANCQGLLTWSGTPHVCLELLAVDTGRQNKAGPPGRLDNLPRCPHRVPPPSPQTFRLRARLLSPP